MQYATRRDFLKTAGIGVGLVAVSGIAGSLVSCAKQTVAETKPSTPSATPASSTTTTGGPTILPWPYKTLDPAAAAERAYTAYSNGGCMYGAFEGIIGELRAKVGAPFDAFPATMMKYGGAGVSGWGTLCGALNGAAAAINLVADPAKVNPIINEVYGWYGVTALPVYKPVKPKFPAIQTSVANSQLCHNSVSRWSTQTGFKTTSPERAERCAWLTASVVQYTVDLLNKQAAGTFKASFTVPASVTGCLSCHGKGGAVENAHITNQTTCTECHDVLPASHPAVKK